MEAILLMNKTTYHKVKRLKLLNFAKEKISAANRLRQKYNVEGLSTNDICKMWE